MMNLGTFLLYLSLIAGARSKLHHVLTIPAQLNSGETQKACVTLQGYNSRADLSVNLLHEAVETPIFKEKVNPPAYFMCKDFPVPAVNKSVPAAVTFSASVGNESVVDRRTVVIVNQNQEGFTFIQLDKPVYKPGQKVLYRLISLNNLLRPLNRNFSAVYITDPSGSRIAQWLHLSSQRGVVQLEFQLISDATPGFYEIHVESTPDTVTATESFNVEEYVLPRFSVSLNGPRTVSVLEDNMDLNISAIYTFGQPVPGSVTIRYCKKAFIYGNRGNCVKDKGDKCLNVTGTLGPDGTFSRVLDLIPLNIGFFIFNSNIELEATVEEEGTGVQVTERHFIGVSTRLASLQFDYQSLQQYYKHRIPYFVRVILLDEKDQPLPNEEIDLWVESKNLKSITDQKGRAEFLIDTSEFVKSNFTLKVSYNNPALCYYSEWERSQFPEIEHQVLRFYSQSGSFLQVQRPPDQLECGKSYRIHVQYILSRDGAGDKGTIYFLVMARSKIVQFGQQNVDLSTSRNGSIAINIQVNPDLAPSAHIIVYSLLQGELIADSVFTNIDTCFKNQVSLSFSPVQGPPASNVSLKLSASPGSLCGLKVIDSSLLLINPFESFSASLVYGFLPGPSGFGYDVDGFNVEEPKPRCEDPSQEIFYKGRYYIPVSSYSEGDTYNVLKELGLIVVTDVRLRKPEVCGYEAPHFPRFTTVGSGFSGDVVRGPVFKEMALAGGSGTIETIRKNFLETFVWKLVTVDSNGKATLTEKVPDTITEWKGSMFCMSEKEGFGMTKVASNFTSFLPFFVEPSLPYSFTRGETMELKAVVSNSLKKCIKIRIDLKNSTDFQAKPQNVKQNICICSGQRASYSWNVDAKTIGELSITLTAETTHIGDTCDGPNDPSQPSRKDTVIKTVLVEAEGIRKEVTSSNLVCLEGSNSQIPLSITPPGNVVPGSANGYVIALGDPVGLPLSNLQNLLQMPFGCGEQNLARMAPIACVLDYLDVTKQLTDTINKTAINFLNEGYYRQLRYKMPDGSYSTFWGWAAEGNSWLAVYTFKTFEKSKKRIFIDENIQHQTLIYLERLQDLKSGCFVPNGRLYMVDTNDKEALMIRFTAHVAIALLESNYSLGKSLLLGAMNCLRNATNVQQSAINKALMLYAFTLAGDTDRRTTLLNNLKQKAVSEGGTLHWERENAPKRVGVPFFFPIYSSADVEITSYILLSMAKGPGITKNDLTYMAQIAVWLIRQQNPYGGFRSTQDTVVALQALVSYAQLIYKPNSSHTVVIRRGNGQVGQLNLNQQNRLLVQRQPLPQVPGDYNIAVSGTGCCLVQSTVRYNIPVPSDNSAFLVSASSSGNCLNGVAHVINITVTVSYRGSRSETNMAIVDVKLLSGYEADDWSLQQLVDNKLISRREQKNNHVYLYLNTVSREPVQLSFKVNMGNRVLNVVGSSIYVYDYYEIDENGYAPYSHPCRR